MIAGWGFVDPEHQVIKPLDKTVFTAEVRRAIAKDTRPVSEIARQYCTSEATIYKMQRRREMRVKVSQLSKSYLSKGQIIAIYEDDRCQAEIAEEFGISKSSVCRIKTGKRFADITGAIEL